MKNRQRLNILTSLVAAVFILSLFSGLRLRKRQKSYSKRIKNSTGYKRRDMKTHKRNSRKLRNNSMKPTKS